jgi:hypothetical protein
MVFCFVQNFFFRQHKSSNNFKLNGRSLTQVVPVSY